MIESDEIDVKETFDNLVSSFEDYPNISSSNDVKRKEKEIFLFLRRVCLSDYFLLDNDVSDNEETNNNYLIDWDEILSISNLSKRYKIALPNLFNMNNGNEFEFRPFIFTKLPQEFLRFALKPYNFPIHQTSKYTLYNLLDYDYLISTYDDFEDDVQIDDEKELIENQKNVHSYLYNTQDLNAHLLFMHSKRVYPSIFLFIGKTASKLIITDIGRIGILKPFYLDQYGCADVGNKRQQPLFLNEYRYERTMDAILSGDFSYYLPL